MSEVLHMKPYQLVNFVQTGEKCIRSVDITLLKWIRYDESKKSLVTKYMPEPYTEQRNKKLYGLIKQNQVPDDRWPEYNIQIVGHAGTVIFFY